MDSEQLIKKYLQGELSENESIQFQQLVENNDEFKADLRIHELMYRDRTEKIKDQLKKELSTNPHAERKSSSKKLRNSILLAIAISGLAMLYYYYERTSAKPLKTEEMIMAHLNLTAPPPPIAMGASIHDSLSWQVATKAYREQKYPEAIAKIKQIETPTDEQIFYLGLSEMYNSPPDYKQALEQFTDILEMENSLLSDQSMWYAALANFKLGDIQKSKELLTIIQQERSWKYKESEELLEFLELE